MEEVQLITTDEQNFVLSYIARLNDIQGKQVVENYVYTRVPLTYAILHNLSFLSLLFHPLSLTVVPSKIKYKPSDDEIKLVIQEIIVHELTKPARSVSLTQQELELVIKHYKTIQ